MNPWKDDTHSGISLLGLLGLAREHDQSLLVDLQTLNIKSLSLLTEIPPSVINHNTNTLSLFPSNTSLFEFSQSETTAFTDLSAVSNGLTTHSGTEERKGANAKGGNLGFACLTAAELAAGLVEPSADAKLPVLAKMILMKYCSR